MKGDKFKAFAEKVGSPTVSVLASATAPVPHPECVGRERCRYYDGDPEQPSVTLCNSALVAMGA